MDCKICGKKAEHYYNISFKKVHICQACADAISKQNIVETLNNRPKKKREE